jgi:hypothetical protein
MIRLLFLILLVFVSIYSTAHAYVGPGLGLGVIGAIIGVVVAVFLAIVGVVWYPVKRLLRKMKAANVISGDDSERGVKESD